MQQKKYQVGGASSITTLIVLSLLWFMSFADRSIMSIALQPIKQAFSLSDSQAGLLGALTVAGISILTIPIAIFGDRWARRKIIMVMAIAWSFFTFTTGLAVQLWHLLVSRFMVGAGEAGYAPAGTAWVSVSFPKEIRALILGIFFCIGQLGAVSGLIFGGMLITATNDWRAPFFVFAVPGIILGIIVFFLRDYKVVKEEGEGVLSKAYFKEWVSLLKIKSYWLVILSHIFFYFTTVSVTIWTPTLLMRTYNLTAGQAGMTFGLVSLVVLMGPLGGFLADRWQKRSTKGRAYWVTLTSGIALICILSAIFSLGMPLPVFMTLFALSWMFCVVNIPVGLTIVNDVIPTKLRSVANGIGTLIVQLLGATTGTLLVGVVSDSLGGGSHGIQWGILSTLPVFALSIVANVVLIKFYPADSAKISDELVAEK
jgi:MFS family permease